MEEGKKCARGDSFFLCPSQRLNFLLLVNELAFPTAFLSKTKIPEISFFLKRGHITDKYIVKVALLIWGDRGGGKQSSSEKTQAKLLLFF